MLKFCPVLRVVRALKRLEPKDRRILATAVAEGSCAAVIAGLLSIVMALPILPVALICGAVVFEVRRRTLFVR